MRTFKANLVSVDELEDLNAYVIVLAENVNGEGARLEIQKALSFDESDRENGMDTYCLGTETGAAHYGGVVGWSIASGVLEISLDPTASSTLDVLAGFRVTFPECHDAELRSGLERLLGSPRSAAEPGPADR